MRLSAPLPPAGVLRGLSVFSAAALAAGMGRAAVTTYLPVALERIRDAPGLIGIVMLVNVAAGFAVPLWVGVWSDRLRARGHGRTLPFILGGSLLTSGGLIAIAAGAGTGYLTLAVAALVTYIGLNAVTTAHRALIPETFDEDDRAGATGAEELAMLLGATLGVAAGGLLVEWRIWAPFAAAAVAVPLIAAPTVLRMRRRERTGPVGRPVVQRAPLRYYARIARRPGVRNVLAAQTLWVLGYAALPSFFVLYAQNQLGLRPSVAGGMLVAFGAVCGAAMLIAGLESRAERHVPLLAAGVVLMGGGLLAMTPADRAVDAAPGLICAAAGFGVLSTLGFPVMARFIPVGEAGAYTAAYFSVRSVAGAVALPAAGGIIAATGSYRSLVAFGGGATLLALAPVALLAERPAGAWRRWVPPPGRRAALRAGALVGALAASALALGLLAERLAPLARADEWLFRRLNAAQEPVELADDLIIGPDARNYAILVIGSLLAALLWRHGRELRILLTVTLSGLVAFGVVRVLWTIWDRDRPQERWADVALGGHDWAPYPSFPSGHVAVWLAMSLAIVAFFPRVRVPLLALVAAVALTRIVGGAHLPSDVVGAAIVGAGAWRIAQTLLDGAYEAAAPTATEGAVAPAVTART